MPVKLLEKEIKILAEQEFRNELILNLKVNYITF